MVLILTVVFVALVCEYINGMHDTANSLARIWSDAVTNLSVSSTILFTPSALEKTGARSFEDSQRSAVPSRRRPEWFSTAPSCLYPGARAAQCCKSSLLLARW